MRERSRRKRFLVKCHPGRTIMTAGTVCNLTIAAVYVPGYWSCRWCEYPKNQRDQPSSHVNTSSSKCSSKLQLELQPSHLPSPSNGSLTHTWHSTPPWWPDARRHDFTYPSSCIQGLWNCRSPPTKNASRSYEVIITLAPGGKCDGFRMLPSLRPFLRIAGKRECEGRRSRKSRSGVV